MNCTDSAHWHTLQYYSIFYSVSVPTFDDEDCHLIHVYPFLPTSAAQLSLFSSANSVAELDTNAQKLTRGGHGKCKLVCVVELILC